MVNVYVGLLFGRGNGTDPGRRCFHATSRHVREIQAVRLLSGPAITGRRTVPACGETMRRRDDAPARGNARAACVQRQDRVRICACFSGHGPYFLPSMKLIMTELYHEFHIKSTAKCFFCLFFSKKRRLQLFLTRAPPGLPRCFSCRPAPSFAGRSIWRLHAACPFRQVRSECAAMPFLLSYA